MASHLEKLPPELLLQIAGYIPRPSDLKALCLASKALRTCALPSLYEAISLDSSASWVPETDKGLLHIGNPGLPYVRRLIIAANGEQDGNAERRFLRLFLSVLPRDQLFEISCSTLELDEETVLMLLAQQKKVVTLRLGPVMCNFALLLQRYHLDWSSLVHLDIPCRIGEHDLPGYQSIIEQAKNLSHLAVRCSEQLRATDPTINLNAGPDLMQDKLFSHVKAGDAQGQLTMDELVFQDIKIWPTTAGLFDLSRLRSICILNCEGAHKLLNALAIDFSKRGCALRYFYFESSPFECTPVENLLRSFSGLEWLRLTSEDHDGSDETFDLKALDGHKDTLQHVLIGCYQLDMDDPTPLLDLDVSVFASFTKLEHLAVPMPPITVPDPTAKSLFEYVALAKSLLSLPLLNSLRILTWPRADDNTFAEYDGEDLVLDNLHRKCFHRDLDDFFYNYLSMHLSKVSLVIYDSAGTNQTSDNLTLLLDLKPVCYVAERRTDVLNNTRTSATRTTLAHAKYLEPLIDEWTY